MTWLQLNKCEMKQPATSSKPDVRTNFHTQKLRKTKLYKCSIWFMVRKVHGANGLHMIRIVRGTNSQWYEKSSNHLLTSSRLFCSLFKWPNCPKSSLLCFIVQ